MALFPIFLKLTGRSCLVIGAGDLAESKIESLRAAEGKHHRHRAPRLPCRRRTGRQQARSSGISGPTPPEMLPPDTFLVVTATDVPEVNRAVYLEATAKSILCNAVDDPPFCDFYFPSVVRRGDLQIAISTAGQSPR